MTSDLVGTHRLFAFSASCCPLASLATTACYASAVPTYNRPTSTLTLPNMRELSAGTIAWDAHVWRYFEPCRFFEVLDTSALYFPSANDLNDPFEGAVYVERADDVPDVAPDQMGMIDQAFSELKRLTKISCWHSAPYESAAMWKLYAASVPAPPSRPVRVRASRSPRRSSPLDRDCPYAPPSPRPLLRCTRCAPFPTGSPPRYPPEPRPTVSWSAETRTKYGTRPLLRAPPRPESPGTATQTASSVPPQRSPAPPQYHAPRATTFPSRPVGSRGWPEVASDRRQRREADGPSVRAI